MKPTILKLIPVICVVAIVSVLLNMPKIGWEPEPIEIHRRCAPITVIESDDKERKRVDAIVVWYEWDEVQAIKANFDTGPFHGFRYLNREGIELK